MSALYRWLWRLPLPRGEDTVTAHPTPMPEGSEESSGRGVDSPNCEQPRPDLAFRLPGSGSAYDYRPLMDYTSQNPQGKAPQNSSAPVLHFPRCSSEDSTSNPLACVLTRGVFGLSYFSGAVNCQIAFCFIHFLKLMRK